MPAGSPATDARPPFAPPAAGLGLREPLLMFALSQALFGLIALFRPLVPFVAQNALVLVAAVFLYLPLGWLNRRNEDPAGLGIGFRARGRQVVVALLASLAIFPPFVLGYHVWHGGVLGRAPQFDWTRLSAWPEKLRGEPSDLATRAGLVAFEDAGRLVIAWLGAVGPDHPAARTVTVACDVPLGRPQALQWRAGRLERVVPAGAAAAGSRDAREVACRLTPGRGCAVALPANAHELRFAAAPDPSGELQLGAFGDRQPLPWQTARSALWLAWFVFLQFALVALPEELFFRGYLQSRLNAVWRRRVRLFGTPVGLALPVTAALFALGHLPLEPRPERLLVFFPGLLFGWLRERSGEIGAAVAVHGLSNVVIRVVAAFYYPL